jgi:hypothetical protein
VVAPPGRLSTTSFSRDFRATAVIWAWNIGGEKPQAYVRDADLFRDHAGAGLLYINRDIGAFPVTTIGYARVSTTDHPPEKVRGVTMRLRVFHSLYLSFGSSA